MVGFSNGSTKDMNDLWAINVMGPFLLTRAALPELRKTGAGRIVNIASTDAKRFRPGSSAGYTMSKHSLLAMTQAVRAEGWDDGIRATALCPGFTYSEFHDVNATRGLVSQLPKYMFMQAEPVVEGAVAAVERGTAVYVPGPWNKFVAWLSRTLPRSWAEQMVKNQSKRFRKKTAH